MENKSAIERKIITAGLDQTTIVRLFQILDKGPTATEIFLINAILDSKERYKKPEIDIDLNFREEFNQP